MQIFVCTAAEILICLITHTTSTSMGVLHNICYLYHIIVLKSETYWILFFYFFVLNFKTQLSPRLLEKKSWNCDNFSFFSVSKKNKNTKSYFWRYYKFFLKKSEISSLWVIRLKINLIAFENNVLALCCFKKVIKVM